MGGVAVMGIVGLTGGLGRVGFLNHSRHRNKFSTLWVSCDGGSSRFKSVYDDMGLSPEMVDVIGADRDQGLTNWKWTIPNLIELREQLQKKNYGLVEFHPVKGMMSSTGFKYTDNEHADSICQFLREIIAEPFGVANVLINHLSNDGKAGSGARRWGEMVAGNLEIKSVMDAVGDGGAKEENHTLRKLCMWKNPIDGRSFIDYKIEDGILVPTRNSKMKGDCFNQMIEMAQKVNFETGARVFHIKELTQLQGTGYGNIP